MNVHRHIHIFIKRQLAYHLRQSRNVYFVWFLMSSMVSLLGLMPWLYWLGNIASASSCAAAVACMLVAMLVWRHGGGLKWGCLIYQVTLMALVLFNAAITGGVASPVLTWLTIIPLLPLFMGFRVGSLLAMVASMVSVIALYILQSRGWLPQLDTQFALQSLSDSTPLADNAWQPLSFGAGMFILMLLAQLALVQIYDTANEQHLRRLRQTNARLENLSTNLKVASAHKDQFLAMVSHEMRTPLNAVMGYLGLLSSDAQLPEPAGQYVKGAHNSAAHLVTVINDLLDFSQIQQGKLVLNLQPVNLRDMLTSTHQTLSPRADQLGVTYPLDIDANVPQWALVDAHRLAQIILNLLGNALKFTSRGQVRMHIGFETTPDNLKLGQLILRVEDTGTGMPESALENIFKPFVQLKISDNDLKAGNALHGNGLGLAITRSLVQSHKGSISVESALGVGSAFTVKLPIDVAEPPMARRPIDPSSANPIELDILVVDDHVTNRLVATASIKRGLPNALIDHAINGNDALTKMREHRYDLVLMDLIMPDISGTEVVRRIRDDADHPYRDVPVIALTANVAEDAVKECLALGFREVLPKPFDRYILVQAILTHAQPQSAQPRAL
ncbi:ATP-binding protein [Limnohabitans sp. B9-3]|uniref:ATP-binding protein n=1 Tax=Limnohabitans sp. B9-3 TaxID=1100707 RepID=UPI0013045BBD|nr:ATP-binding protein [Limnohabitans sp. B9-3]